MLKEGGTLKPNLVRSPTNYLTEASQGGDTDRKIEKRKDLSKKKIDRVTSLRKKAFL